MRLQCVGNVVSLHAQQQAFQQMSAERNNGWQLSWLTMFPMSASLPSIAGECLQYPTLPSIQTKHVGGECRWYLAGALQRIQSGAAATSSSG